MKVRNYKSEVESLRKKFLKFKENYVNKKNKEDLVFDGIDVKSNKKAQKQKLIENEQIAWQSSETLEGMKRKAFEIESVGKEIGRDMDKQGGQMRAMKDKVFQMNEQIDSSDSLMSKMMKRQNRNKIIIGIGAVILLALFIILCILNL